MVCGCQPMNRNMALGINTHLHSVHTLWRRRRQKRGGKQGSGHPSPYHSALAADEPIDGNTAAGINALTSPTHLHTHPLH